MKYLLLAIFLATASHCLALDDTPENRTAQAERYLAAVPPTAYFSQMMSTITKTLPENQRSEFTKVMLESIDANALTATMKQSMVKIFTADELKAQADYYGSPLGQAVMKKMGAYMSDMMPAMQAQMMSAAQKAMSAARKKAASAPAPSDTPATPTTPAAPTSAATP